MLHFEALEQLLNLYRIGEKFLVWSDKSPDLEEIISGVSLYWLTRTFPTSIYHYRVANGFYARKEAGPGNVFLDKPTGYSLFHKEIHPAPLSWAKEKANIVWHKRHEQVCDLSGRARGSHAYISRRAFRCTGTACPALGGCARLCQTSLAVVVVVM